MECNMDGSQYDSLLGGREALPTSLNVGQFFSARIQEIKALTEVVGTPSNAIAEMRSFPKHIRRRAMSHNIKRIPKRLRELHATLREKSNTREGPSKVPRRKFRRRPKDLLNEYNRRQKKCVWLETHIWHAKRFKMVSKWGYKLPFSPCDKSYRACYRATSDNCLVQDISYYNCIELSGPESALLFGLSRHTNSETGLTFAAQASISGNREGSVMFYRAGKYPFGAVGEINFMWKPQSLESDVPRTIWLWCHPGSHEELLIELITTFTLSEIQNDESMEMIDVQKAKSDVEMKKLELRNLRFVCSPKYTNKENVILVDLKDTLNRLRLTGPLSQAVLINNLKPVHLDKRDITEDDWIHEYYLENQINKAACNAQMKFWPSMKYYHSPGQLTPRSIIPLTIIDPRFIMPAFRTKAVDTTSMEQLPVDSELSLSTEYLGSPLWSHSVRQRVTKTKLSTEQLNNMRSNQLVPGMEVDSLEIKNNDHLENLPCLPVILIQRPGSQTSSKRLGYGSGWDVISPSGYAMPLWLSFILSGARAGGLKETEAFNRESANLHSCLQPDTAVGKAEENDKRIQLTEEFFRLPPAKRNNYIKLNIPTPFHCPWSVITNDWEGSEQFYIMRNKKLLFLLHNYLKKNCGKEVSLNEIEVISGALIPVRIDLMGKGILNSNAHICLLQESDLRAPPKEPHKIDEFQEERAKQRLTHKKLLRRLARKRHTARASDREEHLESDKNYKQTILENSSQKYVKEHAETIRNLWLPFCNNVRNICLRTVIGFVSSGDFCFTEGKSSGVGYVTFAGLKECLNTCHSRRNILVRCTNTDQYRLATINVIC